MCLVRLIERARGRPPLRDSHQTLGASKKSKQFNGLAVLLLISCEQAPPVNHGQIARRRAVLSLFVLAIARLICPSNSA